MRRRLAIAMFLALLQIGSAATAYGSARFTTEEVRWKNGDIELVGTFYLPEGNGPFPAAVMLHGSGSLIRSDRLYKEHAERLAQAGLAFLVYDKRGVGSSTGDWKQASLADLADDATGAVKLLRAHKKVAAEKIGLFGVSQGPWVATLLLSRASDFAFMVWLSGLPITPAEQGHYVVEHGLRAKGYDEAAVRKAVELDRRITEVYRTNTEWEKTAAAVQQASSEPWFKDAAIGLQPRDSWNWQWYRKIMDYDPMPVLKKLTVPLFAAYGEADPIVPVRRCLQMLEELRTKDGKDITTIVLANLGHDLGIRKGPQPDQYWERLETWLRHKKILSAS